MFPPLKLTLDIVKIRFFSNPLRFFVGFLFVFFFSVLAIFPLCLFKIDLGNYQKALFLEPFSFFRFFGVFLFFSFFIFVFVYLFLFFFSIFFASFFMFVFIFFFHCHFSFSFFLRVCFHVRFCFHFLCGLRYMFVFLFFMFAVVSFLVLI